MNRTIIHYNRLMELIQEENNYSQKDRPEIHIEKLKKPIAFMFGGADKMLKNILKTMVLLEYLEETDNPNTFKVKKWFVL